MACSDIIHKILNIRRYTHQPAIFQLMNFFFQCSFLSLTFFNITHKLTIACKQMLLE